MWNHCLFCNEEMRPKEGQSPSAALIKKYCNHSCSARANNSNRYDWDEVQRYYDQGHSVKETMEHFGFYSQAWTKAKQRGDVISRGIAPPMPFEHLKTRGSVRRRIIKENLLPYKCSSCGLKEWRGESLSLVLDHINGMANDHRIENLRWMCPNCDSQLPTFAGRNAKH